MANSQTRLQEALPTHDSTAATLGIGLKFFPTTQVRQHLPEAMRQARFLPTWPSFIASRLW